jgi:hypothetical protein
MQCKYCCKNFEDDYRKSKKQRRTQPQFCSMKCAKGFSSKEKRKEINEKLSITMKSNGSAARILTPTARENSLKAWRKICIERFSLPWDKLIETNPSKHLLKRRILLEQSNKCNCCGIDKWNGKSIKFHLHHKDGNGNNITRDNLEVLCPNCHSQTDTYCNIHNFSTKKWNIRFREFRNNYSKL